MHRSSHAFTTHDGATLRYHAWSPVSPNGRAVLLFHRGHEHGLRWQETVENLGLDGSTFYAWDQRGHGSSDGKRGHAESLAAIVKDAEWFARHLQREHGVDLRQTAVVAHSVGAVIAAAWVHDYAPPVRAMVLATPAFRVKLYIPLALPALRLKQKLLGPGVVKSYVKASMVTGDPAQRVIYGRDPLVFREIATNILIDLRDTASRLLADAAAVTTPTLTFTADRDWVVRTAPQRVFHDAVNSPHKRFVLLRGFRHAVFHESGRREVTSAISGFINEAFARSGPPSLLDADKAGHTKSEFDRLSAPSGSPLWPLQRAFLRRVGPLSDGVKLGWRSGFDSGVTLDYIYENRARGRTPLGRLIDRNYLDALGWRGIRVRREHLQRTLRAAVERTAAEGRPVRILDTAAGAGRYILDTIAATPAVPISAHLRDYKQENLNAARARIRELGLTTVTTERADAFDRGSIASVSPRPTIAVVSGLYELFPANAPLRESLGGLADALEPGSLLIYTNQPWHPQMEFIARVLVNREGRPWVMRRRTQQEMDQLVEAAGFEKLSQEVDRWGIFTVSLARKR
ncbi:MAG TPA: bifunctional alpha/beta hydrolase/class I SAM-dependent methyltransferase [Phycisphaerales bacterium]|nr:bifunctional alpha/beta hydrolase/class I SAM-dependent methyltransferase [Phycisphaerales bacterium]